MQVTPLSYQTDLAQFIAPLAESPGAVLLDSQGMGGEFGRYDIFSAYPFAYFVVKNQRSYWETSDQQQPLPGKPWEALAQQLQSYSHPPSDWPFIGGALGHINYDMAWAGHNKLPTSEKPQLIPDMRLGFYDWTIVTDHLRQQTVLIQAGFSAATPTLLQTLLPLLDAADSPAIVPFQLSHSFHSHLDWQDYQTCLQQILAYIHAGDCYQINFSRQFSSHYQGSVWQAYQRLKRHNPAPFAAYLNYADYQIISCSPELFLHCVDQQVTTKPIKGTRPRHPDPIEDAQLKTALQASAKDRAENLMIVDLLRNDLGRCSQAGQVTVEQLFACESYASVHHLVSRITSQLQADVSITQLLATAFPGGSITGAPKLRAMQIIDQLEPHRRHIYCGSMGYISFCGSSCTNVAIRTLLFQQSQVLTWAGGGIVADSQPEAEFQETLDKVQGIFTALEP